MTQRLSCSTACGIFPDQGWNPCLLRWQVDLDSLPLSLVALARDQVLITGSGRSPGEGNDNPLQYSCLENLWIEEPGSPWGPKE